MNTSRLQPMAIAERLDAVRMRIERAAVDAGRDPATIELVAVSKRQPVAAVEAAVAAGQRHFGENYLQDALDKMDALAERDLVWHFIGDIQSNKTRDIAARFDWVHAIDRFKIARRLSEQRDPTQSPLNVCIQVNLDGSDSKSGVAPDDAADLAAKIAELDKLTLRGLMTLPEPASEFCAQRTPFARLAVLAATLKQHGHPLDTLSMGMTDDLKAAIAEGATCVRVGTAVFGPRPD